MSPIQGSVSLGGDTLAVNALREALNAYRSDRNGDALAFRVEQFLFRICGNSNEG
jgi:hypothetical protein